MSKIDLKHKNRSNIDKFLCEICLAAEKLELHRVIPGKFGGTYDSDNVMVLCKRCHSLIHRFARIKIKTIGYVDWHELPAIVKHFLKIDR